MLNNICLFRINIESVYAHTHNVICKCTFILVVDFDFSLTSGDRPNSAQPTSVLSKSQNVIHGWTLRRESVAVQLVVVLPPRSTVHDEKKHCKRPASKYPILLLFV